MAQGINVMLDPNDATSLRKDIYSIITSEIERARCDAGINKPFLRRKEVLQFLNVSGSTLDSWNLPSHKIDGIVLYSKKDITDYIESH